MEDPGKNSVTVGSCRIGIQKNLLRGLVGAEETEGLEEGSLPQIPLGWHESAQRRRCRKHSPNAAERT
jgi:hypothetical protein